MDFIYNTTGHELMIPNIVDSEGIYVFDENGKKYMDLESGVWCTSIGHNIDRINEVINKQIDSIMHAGFCYSNQILQEAAQAVLEITDLKDGKCVFLCSGSEGIELSRQIAKCITGKKRSLTLHDSYLGSYSSVVDRTKGWHIFNWEDCKRCEKKDNCDPTCKLLQEIPEDISDFVFEPGSSSGFVRFPPKSMIQNIAAIVRRNKGKVIVNEVTTGTGRTGKWFGYQHYDLAPDMVAIGKGIGNGYPVSVAVISQQTAAELDQHPFKYMQSHQNDPLGAAVVMEVIKIIEDNELIAHAEEVGAKFLEQLEQLVDNKIIGDVRGRGLLFAVDVVNEDAVDEIYRALIEKGFIVGNRKTSFRIDPPLNVTEQEFSDFIETFQSILASMQHEP